MAKLLCIKRTNTDPYYNLATEEYVLHHFENDTFMLWRNEPAIIVGKHQNTLAEINVDYVKEKDIPVVRRLSGGGAVFHDLGNLNFTFTQRGNKEELINFQKYTKPIIDILKELGIDARFEGRNDITIEGKKFSGNAEHVYRDKVLHHGTLLFSSEMTDLSAALKVTETKFKDKAVKSVRSRVTNISEHLPEEHKDLSVLDFKNRVMNHIVNHFPDTELYQLTEEDDQAIKKLVEEKYETWDWNFGYSPQYNFSQTIKTDGGHIEINLDVHDGLIKQAKFYGDYFNSKPTHVIEDLMSGTPHEYNKIMDKLNEVKFNDYFNKVNKEEFVRGMF
ncbi:MAG: lipoate--protein ligase [Bacteroidota bacterium]